MNNIRKFERFYNLVHGANIQYVIKVLSTVNSPQSLVYLVVIACPTAYGKFTGVDIQQYLTWANRFLKEASPTDENRKWSRRTSSGNRRTTEQDANQQLRVTDAMLLRLTITDCLSSSSQRKATWLLLLPGSDVNTHIKWTGRRLLISLCLPLLISLNFFK